MQQDKQLSMTVGRDYRGFQKYEYVIYEGENVVARCGWFASSTTAKRAGLKLLETLSTIEKKSV